MLSLKDKIPRGCPDTHMFPKGLSYRGLFCSTSQTEYIKFQHLESSARI